MNPSKFPSPISPLSLELTDLEFQTKEAWTAYDLGRALSSLDSIYSTFVLTRHLAVIANQRLQQSAEHLERYWEFLEREGPHLDMLAHEWRHLLRRYGPGAASLVFPFGPFRGPAAEQAAQTLPAAEVDYYLRNPSEYLPPSHELRIRRIEIASPGGFTLAGLGEPLREVREFIKDLCYRNRQERQKGDLEILKQKLEIMAQHNLTPVHVQMLASSTISEAEEVAGFIQDGHLLLEGSACPPSETSNESRGQRRKRKPRPSATHEST
jgi:hypothetical protein